MISTGLSFQIRRIPFRATLWFIVTLVLVNFERLQPLFSDPVFSLFAFFEGIIVVAVIFIVHELGHCWAYRRSGQEPAVLLWGIGGLTVGQGPVPPKREIFIEICGLLAPVLFLLAPVLLLQSTVLANLSTRELPSRMLFLTISDVRLFTILWTLVNLLPIIPLDGGHICEALLEWISGEPRKQTARLVSVVTGIVFGIWAFFIMGALGGLFVGWILALHNFLAYRHEQDPSAPRLDLVPEKETAGGIEPNVVSMDSARRKRERRSPAELVQSGYDTLEHRDYSGVLRITERLRTKHLNSSQQNETAQLAAWAWLGQHNPGKAETELADLPRGASASAPLAAVLALANKNTDRGMELMVHTMIREPDSHPKLIAVDLFAEYGMTHRLARELVDTPGGSGFEAAVALEGLLHRLHRTQDASTVSDVILLG